MVIFFYFLFSYFYFDPQDIISKNHLYSDSFKIKLIVFIFKMNKKKMKKFDEQICSFF